MNKIAFIDFDGTICPNKGNNIDPPPTKECLETINILKEKGYEIVIYSVRSNLGETNKPNGHGEMLDYLNKYNIPYDRIDESKPHFSILIDDKCAGIPKDYNRNVDWKRIKEII